MKKLVLMVVALLSTSAAHSMETTVNDSFGWDDILAMLDETTKEQDGAIKTSEEMTGITHTGSASSSQELEAVVPTQTAAVATILYPQLFRSPNIKDAFLNCIDREKKGMHGGFFRFTLYDVAQAMVAKKLPIHLIVDKAHFNHTDKKGRFVESNEFCSALRLIATHGGHVYKMHKERFPNDPGYFEQMHHKFMIFEDINGKKILFKGTWNGTGQASTKNSEISEITDNQASIEFFEEEYTILKEHSVEVPSTDCVTKRDRELGSSANFARRMNGIPELH